MVKDSVRPLQIIFPIFLGSGAGLGAEDPDEYTSAS